MKEFRAGANPNNEFGFHFTNLKGAKSITDSAEIYASKSGVWGAGVYTGTVSTPSWALKHIPFFGWGLGEAPFRIPVNLSNIGKTIKISTPILPPKAKVIKAKEVLKLKGK